MTVSAVIVNYHTASFLPGAVKELAGNPNVQQILIVDNSGELSSGSGLRDAPLVEIIPNEVNRGFGAAVNQAVAMAGTEWILVMNPDMVLLNGSLSAMLDASETYGSPLVGPRFFWDDQKRFRLPPALGTCLWLQVAWQSAASFELDAELFSFYWILRHERFWNATEPFFEPFLSGGCLLINRPWVISMGGKVFDERFFLYFEDTDLCARALGTGVRPLCVPAAGAIHYVDQSPAPEGKKADYMAQAHAQFLKKYYGPVSMPSWGSRDHSGIITDLGVVRVPQIFDPGQSPASVDCFFEVALNPYFVPFAQSALTGPAFEFPKDVWGRLSPGQYFGRIRSSQTGTLRVWTWLKVDPIAGHGPHEESV
jgi:GT2 family glycosyltransferase